jgi:hypothetical protein
LAGEALVNVRKRRTIDGYMCNTSTSDNKDLFRSEVGEAVTRFGFGINKNIHFDYVGVPNHQKNG